MLLNSKSDIFEMRPPYVLESYVSKSKSPDGGYVRHAGNGWFKYPNKELITSTLRNNKYKLKAINIENYTIANDLVLLQRKILKETGILEQVQDVRVTIHTTLKVANYNIFTGINLCVDDNIEIFIHEWIHFLQLLTIDGDCWGDDGGHNEQFFNIYNYMINQLI